MMELQEQKEFVAQMYTDDINLGLDATSQLTEETFASILKKNASATSLPGLSVSSSDPSVTLTPGKVSAIVFYNSLGWTRNEYVSVSVGSPVYEVIVKDANGNTLPSDLNPSFFSNSATSEVWFQISVPPLGYTTYFMSLDTSTPYVIPKFVQIDSDLEIQNSFLKVKFSNSTGRLSSITNLKSGISVDVDQNIYAYTSGYYEGQASGAYVFLPVGEALPITDSPVSTFVMRNSDGSIHGDNVHLVYQTWRTEDTKDWMQQIYVLWDSDDELIGNHLISVSKIGVLPQGTELITRFSSSLDTGNTFYTDSEGYEMQTRVWDPTLHYKYTANYYPAVYSAYIEESLFDNSPRLTLIFDSSHGVSSQGQGTIEAMLHRSCLRDDSKGVEEVLNDTTIVYPYVFVNFETRDKSSYYRHQLEYLKNFSPLVAVGSATSISEWESYYRTSESSLIADLPRNIHLLSFKALNGHSSTNILRLAHIFEADEDEDYSQSVTVDVTTLFADRSVSSCVETTLSANSQIGTNCKVTLQPKEIRTFLIEFA